MITLSLVNINENDIRIFCQSKKIVAVASLTVFWNGINLHEMHYILFIAYNLYFSNNNFIYIYIHNVYDFGNFK